MELEWSRFLRRPLLAADQALTRAAAQGRRVLLTGAGGFLGAGLARAVLAGGPAALVLVDVSEHAVYETHRLLRGFARDQHIEIAPVVGSVLDQPLLRHLFLRYRPDLVLHAAAYKQVPLMEENPRSAVANNLLGTWRLASAALEGGCGQLVMISTDKAVHPASVMGATKRAAELAMLACSTREVRMSALRLGNVLGSSGSVVPLWQEQLEQGRPLTVSHPDARRYFITPAEAEHAVLRAVSAGLAERILIADCGPELRVADLACYVARSYGLEPRIEWTGLRPGDKLSEQMIAANEVVEGTPIARMRVVRSPPTPDKLADAVRRIELAIDSFDQVTLMAALSSLVPEYDRATRAETEQCRP